MEEVGEGRRIQTRPTRVDSHSRFVRRASSATRFATVVAMEGVVMVVVDGDEREEEKEVVGP